MDYDKRLNEIKENLDKAKGLRIRAEARLEELTKQQGEILKELEDLGVRPEQLDGEILKLKSEIEELIERASQLIPQEILKSN